MNRSSRRHYQRAAKPAPIDWSTLPKTRTEPLKTVEGPPPLDPGIVAGALKGWRQRTGREPIDAEFEVVEEPAPMLELEARQ